MHAPWEAIIKYNVLSPIGVFVLGGIYLYDKPVSLVHVCLAISFLRVRVKVHALGQNDAECQLLLGKKIQSEITTASSHCCLAKKDAVKLGINFTPTNRGKFICSF